MPSEFGDLSYSNIGSLHVKKPINEFIQATQQLNKNYEVAEQASDTFKSILDNLEKRDINAPGLKEELGKYQSEISSIAGEGRYEHALPKIKKLVRDYSGNQKIKGIVQDYQLSQNWRTKEQKRLDDKDITEGDLKLANAINYYERNTKPVEVDPITGQVQNLFNPVNTPTNIDVEKEIVTLADKIKDRSLPPEIANQIPGYHTIATGKGVTEAQYQEFARDYIMSRKDVQDLYKFRAKGQEVMARLQEDGTLAEYTPSNLQSAGLVNAQGQVEKTVFKEVEKTINGKKVKVRQAVKEPDIETTARLYNEDGTINQNMASALVQNDIYKEQVTNTMNLVGGLAHNITDLDYLENKEAALNRSMRLAEFSHGLTESDKISPYATAVADLAIDGKTFIDAQKSEALLGKNITGDKIIGGAINIKGTADALNSLTKGLNLDVPSSTFYNYYSALKEAARLHNQEGDMAIPEVMIRSLSGFFAPSTGPISVVAKKEEERKAAINKMVPLYRNDPRYADASLETIEAVIKNDIGTLVNNFNQNHNKIKDAITKLESIYTPLKKVIVHNPLLDTKIDDKTGQAYNLSQEDGRTMAHIRLENIELDELNSDEIAKLLEAGIITKTTTDGQTSKSTYNVVGQMPIYFSETGQQAFEGGAYTQRQRNLLSEAVNVLQYSNKIQKQVNAYESVKSTLPETVTNKIDNLAAAIKGTRNIAERNQLANELSAELSKATNRVTPVRGPQSFNFENNPIINPLIPPSQ